MVGFTAPPCDAGVIGATPAFPAALSERRKRLTLAATILGSSMAFIDGSVVNIALPARPIARRSRARPCPAFPTMTQRRPLTVQQEKIAQIGRVGQH
jgi:hypothetical protein